MALALAIRFDFRDGKNKRSFTKVRVPTGFSISDYIEFAQAMGQLYADASGCIVTGASISIGLDLSTSVIKAVAAFVSDIAQKAFFQFTTALAGFRSKLFLPAIDESLVPVGSDEIDTADPDVAAFVTAMENGIVVSGPATISPCDDRENDITVNEFARELFRKK